MPGYHDHVYKDVPTIAEKIHAEQELDNAVDKFAEKVFFIFIFFFVNFYLNICII